MCTYLIWMTLPTMWVATNDIHILVPYKVKPWAARRLTTCADAGKLS